MEGLMKLTLSEVHNWSGEAKVDERRRIKNPLSDFVEKLGPTFLSKHSAA